MPCYATNSTQVSMLVAFLFSLKIEDYQKGNVEILL